MPIRYLPIALVVILCTELTALAGDSLSTLRSEVRTPSASPPADTDHDHDDDNHDEEDHGHNHNYFGDISMSGGVFIAAVTSPWWVPAAMVGDDYSRRGYFARHPYATMQTGQRSYAYMIMNPRDELPVYTWAGRVSGYYGDDFDSLSTVNGKLLLEHSTRFGLDSTVDYRHQDLGGGLSDELYTGDVNFVYRFAQCEVLQMRSGVGFNYLSDRIGSDYGFNFTYGGDILLGDPVILSTELDLGKLGEASLTHFRTTLGATYQGVEVFTGYDYYEVGDADMSTFINGVRIWF